MDQLETNWKYRLIPYKDDRFAIEILENKYKGIVFLAGRVQFTPVQGDDRMQFHYEYDILENPKKKKETKDLKKMIGDIIIQLLYKKYSKEPEDEYIELDGREPDSFSGNEE